MALAAVLLLMTPVPANAQSTSSPCKFIRDFKRLHDMAPSIVGDCTSRRIFAADGDVLQYTAHGLMVRRGADNWTAFTDGQTTWIDGPEGLVSRPNGERFSWERDASAAESQPPAASARLGPASAYPDPMLTPGATDPRVGQRNIHRTICADGYAVQAQPSATYADRIMRGQMTRYGYDSADAGNFELDHLVPIELGGDPDAPSNMWPQPKTPSPGASEKDQVEGYLHAQVCSGEMTLAAAQQAVLNDWVAVYQQMPAKELGSAD